MALPRFLRFLGVLVGVLGLGVGALALLAGSTLVAPAPAAIPDAGLPIAHENVLIQSDSGSQLHGWYLPAAPGRGSVVLMHGIRANRLSMVRRALFLHRAGYSVLLFDFQAHGESPGRHITLGSLESRDARAALAFVRRRQPRDFVGAIGVSLGGASAVLGSPPLDVDALVLEAVYPDVRKAVENRLDLRFGAPGRFLAPLLLAQLGPRLGVTPADLRPVDGVAHAVAPVLIVAGSADRHTTLRDSERLYAAAPAGRKELWIVPGAAHVDLAAYTGPEYERRILSFFARNAPGRP